MINDSLPPNSQNLYFNRFFTLQSSLQYDSRKIPRFPRLGHSDHLFRHPVGHRHLGKHQAQERFVAIPGRTLAPLASHRLFHVGHQRGTLYADSLGFGWFHHGYRLGQLCLVCFRVYLPAGVCLCTALSGQQREHTARVHGTALRTADAQHPGMVHHRHGAHLVARPDALCRRHPYPSGVRHPHVGIGLHPAGHLCLLHHARRTEGRGLHQRLSDDPAHRRFGHAHHCGTLKSGRHQRTHRCRTVKLLEPLPAQR